MKLSLDAKKRENTGKSANTHLRAAGEVPAVLYGREVEGSLNLAVDVRDISALLKKGALNNVLVDLKVDDDTRQVLIKDIDLHPVNSQLLHVDFHQVSPSDKVQVKVPVNLVGESIGVKEENGIVDQPVRSLRVACRADNIPETIEIDISDMEIGDTVTVGDIPLSADVEIMSGDSRTVASIQPPEEFDLTVTPAAGVETIEETVEEAMEKVGEEGEEALEGEGEEEAEAEEVSEEAKSG